MVFWKRQTIIIESIQVFSRTKGKGWELKEKKKKRPCDTLWGDGNFLKLDSGGSCPTNDFY